MIIEKAGWQRIKPLGAAYLPFLLQGNALYECAKCIILRQWVNACIVEFTLPNLFSADGNGLCKQLAGATFFAEEELDIAVIP